MLRFALRMKENAIDGSLQREYSIAIKIGEKIKLQIKKG